MKRARLFITTLFLFLLILSGCKGTAVQGQGKPPVVATVNGVAIAADEVALRLGGHGDLSDPAAKEKVVDAIIAEELMYQKAVKLGFDKDQKFQSDIRKLELRVLAYKRAEMARRVRDTQIASRVTVTAQGARDFYTKHEQEIGTDLHLGVLQFPDAAKAKESLTGIRKGMRFERIAALEFANAPKGMGRAWDKVFLHWEQVPAAFTDEVYRLKKGEVSEVLSSGPSEAYLVKVIDRRKNTKANFDKAKPVIENRLWAVKGKEAYEAYIAGLKREAKITKK